jgi:hypothetical protein
MQRQSVTLLDKLCAIWQRVWDHYLRCSINQKHVNFDSVDFDVANSKLQRVERLIEAASRRQAKREGWVWPAKAV